MARELQREVGFDSSADLSAVAKQLPAAMRRCWRRIAASHLPNLFLTILAVAELARIGGDQDAVE